MTDRKHRWIALGEAAVSDYAAREWAAAGEEEVAIVDAPVEVSYFATICAVCLERHEDAPVECSGPLDEGTEHVWSMMLTSVLTDEEASALAGDEDPVGATRPQAVVVVCVLCGSSAEQADEECPERALWAGPTGSPPDRG